MEIESRFRLLYKGKRVFGKGPCLLLETIDRLGSLNKACMELNISYSKAWGIIKRAEELLEFNLLESTKGGTDGGGSYLTPKGKKIVEAYRGFCEEVEEEIDRIFEKYFGNL